MAKIYTIKGESGKRMDDTARDFEFTRTLRASLELRGLDGDTLGYGTELLGPDLTGVVVPEEGQVVELFQDATRIFRGHVASVEYEHSKGHRAKIEAVGPKWWMTRILLTDALAEDQDGNTDERPIVTFEEGTIQAHLAALLTRSVALGVPISTDATGIENCFEVPNLSFAAKSCWDVLAGLLKWVPDGMFFWDYSGTLPKARFVRRASAGTLTYSFGSSPLVSLKVRARIDKEVSKVEVPFAKRNDAGLMVWDKQSSGSGTDNAQRQMVNISGPENVAFLPPDLAEKVTMRKFGSLTEAYAVFDPATRYFVDRWGRNPLNGSLKTVTSSTLYSSSTSSSGYGISTSSTQFYVPVLSYGGSSASPNAVVVSVYTAVFFGELADETPPEWLRDQLGLVQGEITGGLHTSFDYDGSLSQEEVDDLLSICGDYNRIDTSPSPDKSYWGKILAGATVYPNGENNPPYSHQPKPIVWLCPTANLPTFVSGSADVYRAHQYGFVFPPATLAADLLATQHFVPWEGTVGIAKDGEFLPSSILGKKLNVTGGQTAYETMGALIQGLDLDLAQGSGTIRLGTPSRIDSRTLAETFSVSAQNNIVPL